MEIKIIIPNKIYEENEHHINDLLNELNEVLGRMSEEIEILERE